MTTLATAKFFTAAKDITATSGGASSDVIYTCPNNFIALIRYLHVSNGDAQKKISIHWYDSSATSYHHIADEFKPDANTVHEFIQGGGYIALEAGDKIVAHKESGGDFHIILSGEEHYQPTAHT
tara:strand:- start:341 stop:712 length:372 start_codon:yes stop_codon:yes gene_type:complete